MGGPMNIYEYDLYPWLLREKQFILETLRRDAAVLGVCLGAQLIADVLGGRVTRNKHKEIGWFPLALAPEAARSPIFAGFPRVFTAFHWHGDTFSIPPGATRLGGSKACDNQGFFLGDRVLGLQFHLDYSLKSIRAMIAHCGAELAESPFIQTPAQILAEPGHVKSACGLLYKLLCSSTLVCQTTAQENDGCCDNRRGGFHRFLRFQRHSPGDDKSL
jgi:GMP synthase-like glutamine amidotransferase